MAKNEIFRYADHISLPVPDGTVSGDPVVVGSFVGVAQTDRDANGTATVWRKGAHKLDVSTAVATVGAPLYLPAGSKQLTTTATGNTLFGYAMETKTAATAPITVAIAQV